MPIPSYVAYSTIQCADHEYKDASNLKTERNEGKHVMSESKEAIHWASEKAFVEPPLENLASSTSSVFNPDLQISIDP
jgi:hypothetical protein